VYDFVKQGADMCIVMKRYERSLEDLLQEQTALPQDQVLVLALHIARALAGLHAAEIRVQDLKPGNILLDKEGMPHISDFGVAAIEGATQTKSSFGTPTYMCPGETSLGVKTAPVKYVWTTYRDI
jgi:serine/threonine protein kinase